MKLLTGPDGGTKVIAMHQLCKEEVRLNRHTHA